MMVAPAAAALQQTGEDEQLEEMNRPHTILVARRMPNAAAMDTFALSDCNTEDTF
jgi:hypothetical protein